MGNSNVSCFVFCHVALDLSRPTCTSTCACIWPCSPACFAYTVYVCVHCVHCVWLMVAFVYLHSESMCLSAWIRVRLCVCVFVCVFVCTSLDQCVCFFLGLRPIHSFVYADHSDRRLSLQLSHNQLSQTHMIIISV